MSPTMYYAFPLNFHIWKSFHGFTYLEEFIWKQKLKDKSFLRYELNSLHSLQELETPPIDRQKQEQPNYVNKMSIPRSGFKSEVVRRTEMVHPTTPQSNTDKNSTNNNMQTVKTSSYIEHATINTVRDSEARFRIL